MGDARGIGGELSLMAWARRSAEDLPAFFVIDTPARLAALAKQTGLNIPIAAIDTPSEACAAFRDALPVLPVQSDQETPEGQSHATVASIDQAVTLALHDQAKAIVTNPINKKVLYDTGFEFQGHTDYLEHLAHAHTNASRRSVMMLCCHALRTVPLTVHIPLAQVPGAISQRLIIETATVIGQALKTDFGIREPHLAITGLNPHAGEQGGLGSEETDTIIPAIDQLSEHGVSVSGPHPADTIFHERARRDYDAVLCMYHDQALIPVKTLDFDRGVNVTLGLPFIRTSPDHGTAYDIAGTGQANPDSFVAALKLADQLADHRQRHNAHTPKPDG